MRILFTIISLILGAGLGLKLTSAGQAFNLLLMIGAGTGLIYILRWFWWRINAFSEIVAMVVSFIVALYFEFGTNVAWASHQKLLMGIALTTAAWLVTTFVAPRTDNATLETFYRLIKPSGPGWQRVRDQLADATEPLPISPPEDNIPQALMNIFLGCVGTYSALFTIGLFLYGQLPMAILLGAIAVFAFFLLFRSRYRRLTHKITA